MTLKPSEMIAGALVPGPSSRQRPAIDLTLSA